MLGKLEEKKLLDMLGDVALPERQIAAKAPRSVAHRKGASGDPVLADDERDGDIYDDWVDDLWAELKRPMLVCLSVP